MNYKIPIIAAAVAAVGAIVTSQQLKIGTMETSRLLQKSQNELKTAQEAEKESAAKLAQVKDSFGDISEEDYKKAQAAAEEKEAEAKALRQEVEALVESVNSESQQLSTQINELRRRNRDLENNIRGLDNELRDFVGFTNKNINRIIAARLNLLKPEGITRQKLGTLFCESITLNGEQISLDTYAETLKKEHEAYAPRAIKLLGSATRRRDSTLELLVAFVYEPNINKGTSGGDRSGYLKITYRLDAKGRIHTIKEELSQKPHTTTRGFSSFPFKGETSVVVK